MKRVLIAALLLAAPALHAQDPAPAEPDSAVREARAARTYPLETVDVRPVPLNMEGFTRALHRLYPPELRSVGVEGTVLVEMVVNERGLVEDVTIVRSAHPQLDAASLLVIHDLRFRPGQVGGRPVRTRLMLPIQWTVND